MKHRLIILSLAMLLAGPGHGASGKGLEFNGGVRTEGVLQHLIDTEGPDSLFFAGFNLLMLNFKNANRQHAAVFADVDVLLLHGEYARQAAGAAGGLDPAIIDLMPAFIDIRKLYLSLYLPFADVSVGRQIVNLGKGMLFSPVDVFTTINIYDLNFRRRGSDAFRMNVPFNETSGADVIAEIPGADTRNTAALKLYTNIFDWDISGVSMFREETDEVIAALTFKGDAFVGLYGELAGHFMGTFDDRFLEAMAGVDYSINNQWFFLLEYYFNQREIEGDSVSLPLLQKVQRPFFKKYYGFLSAQYRFNELMNVSAGVIHNIEDNRSILTMQYFYNILQNANTIFFCRGYNGNINDMDLPGMVDMEYGLRIEVLF